MNPQDYWQKQHQKYSTFDWITKPTMFAQQIVNFLPENGKLIDLGAGQGQDSRFLLKIIFKLPALILPKML